MFKVGLLSLYILAKLSRLGLNSSAYVPGLTIKFKLSVMLGPMSLTCACMADNYRYVGSCRDGASGEDIQQ